MQCPIDGETLLMTSRQGVEIDYCPRCRGVWLDRGELDKIIERSAHELDSANVHTISKSRQRDDDDDDDDDDKKERKWSRDDRRKWEKTKRDSKPDFYRKSKKHASFIKELFDF